MFTGKKLEVSHLKIFGCPVFVHIPKEKRTKLDPSRKKGIFVGYYDVSKAFRIYITCYHHTDPYGDKWPPTCSTGSKQLSIVAVS